MTAPTFRCVVDASAVVPLYRSESLTAVATTLFDLLAVDPRVIFHVPDLFFIECANIFWKHAQRGNWLPADAEVAMRNLLALRLERTPTFDLTADALPIALRHDITAYDASYVALAQRHGVPLITADDKLIRKLAGSAYALTWLGSWTPPSTP